MTGDSAKLTAIRGVLADFDWERDDRQHALEAIERIVSAKQDRRASNKLPRGSAEERTAFIADLRELADFLESSPDVPVPNFGTTILVSGQFADDPRAFVDRFAALTAAVVDDDWEAAGHYRASAEFGLVKYEAYALSQAVMDELFSGRGRVQPGAAPADPGEVA